LSNEELPTGVEFGVTYKTGNLSASTNKC